MTKLDITGLLMGWDLIAADELAPNHCILGSRTLFEALRRLGADPQIVLTETLAANREAAGYIERGIRHPEWPPTAWSVGAVMSAPGDGYPGHVVVVVDTDDNGRMIVDSSTGQFVRERYGILPPPSLAVKAPSDDWPTDPNVSARYVTPGWEISWRWTPELGNIHRSAPDWRRGRTAYVDRVLHLAGIVTGRS